MSALFTNAEALAEDVLCRVGKNIVLALPLGLGKANHIANALYAKAAVDRSINLTIFTALTLEAPRAKSELERLFLDPIAQRLFAGYPPLDYAAAIRAGKVLAVGASGTVRGTSPAHRSSPRFSAARSWRVRTSLTVSERTAGSSRGAQENRLYGWYGGATPQPQCGTGACCTSSAPGWELCMASRVPHSR